MKKLHLGCGNNIIPNFININIENKKADIKADVSNLYQFENNSIDLIYACHILEHFGRKEYLNVLKEWIRILKIGGTIRLSVPSFESVVIHYIDNKDIKKLQGLLNGGQKNIFDYHYMCFDEKLLKSDLEKLGCKNCKIWDWRKTEHSQYDDYSQSYLPHMDKENGQLMSLNMEGIKWK